MPKLCFVLSHERSTRQTVPMCESAAVHPPCSSTVDAGLIDELHFVIVPILIDAGERLFDHLHTGLAGYECVEIVNSSGVAHVRLARSSTGGG